MESGRLFFNPSGCSGNMLFLGNLDPVFRGPRSSMLNLEDTSRKRPFFMSSPEDFFDEEYYEEQLPEKKRRLTQEQVDLLEKSFEAENKLEPDRKTQLAKKLGLQPRQVAVWFQNRRARWKTKQVERDYDLLKASYDSLLSDYDAAVKQNERLKSEVVSLNEKLEAKDMPGEPQQKSDSLTADIASGFSLQMGVKAEDHLSSGSTRSAVVDEGSPQLLDSEDSFFENNNCGECIIGGPVDFLQSEEDDGGSDDGRSYFSDVFVTAGEQQEDEEPLEWWVWS